MSNELIFGFHSVEAILAKEPERFLEIYALKGREDKRLNPVIDQARKFGISVQFMQRKALDNKANGEQHQGIIANVKAARMYNEKDLDEIIAREETPFLLVLDGITDPHNLGACLRSADAAGVHAIIVPKDKSAKLNGTARKVACGAAETVPLVQVTNLARTLREIKDAGVWVVGTAGETDTELFDANLTGPMAVVMGAEGDGMRRLTREHCDLLVKIPMAGTVSSLNVSVATGICLFEVLRQRNATQL
ncbi:MULTISPECIES: 23S rRNA (guanosine(2251)-2'-O)-methyltransferase RlmB [Pseudoalteromonas]|uniref:23S rRNA (guanosine(2251)-2'-O)-methyltransferase RlmB n=1 Tax=Pseudoalteromonas TaxID=53246 RepID=UPI0007857800|nr:MULTISPECIES: 23S rRNA (guanosine(2251)-2'-O)-methyltransferase RlmB [Gammaproteobacteria]MCF7501387.1 23S rRNA (guanosine(2251)-2'-O)-methyltransferase RlmB [Pseudoalteromonas sp. L1]MCF7517409.1 23S rRNA (guanosine(2251)-2'-O)-methyltransferase RlmB [Pseudoalteromonas sp. L21]RZF94600.1 23S rRNA (guanosine(2251)-2'-O)-methyltransferase RlmB [Pseudoalteromonas sp. CO302Y]RZG11227.1 23S rRNA (guanosine(2251)-2'-O)-methyltransferase RlmB [Pseudoalteromonas sp. CO133X]UJX25066.1 23S rRNA (gua